jgi:hypothetical protein
MTLAVRLTPAPEGSSRYAVRPTVGRLPRLVRCRRFRCRARDARSLARSGSAPERHGSREDARIPVAGAAVARGVPRLVAGRERHGHGRCRAAPMSAGHPGRAIRSRMCPRQP